MVAVEFGGVLALLIVSFAWRSIILGVLGQGRPYYRLAMIWLPASLDLFALGISLAILSAWYHHENREPKVFSHPAFPWVSWAIAGFCFWAVSNLGLPVVPLYFPSTIEILRQTLYGLFAFFLLLPAVFGPQHKGLIRRGLQLWPVASLGVISYGIYLWHETWIYEILRWGHYADFNIEFVKFFLAVMALTIASASVSYFCLEKPVLRFKRLFAWFDDRRGRPPS